MDEQPVGGGKKLEISEYPDDAGPMEMQEESAAVLPLQVRLKSKVWKQRMSAFDELVELFQKDSQSFEPYYEEWPKLINDNNPGS